MKAYKGNTGTAPLLLNLSARWMNGHIHNLAILLLGKDPSIRNEEETGWAP
jgi:hypothetical protein